MHEALHLVNLPLLPRDSISQLGSCVGRSQLLTADDYQEYSSWLRAPSPSRRQQLPTHPFRLFTSVIVQATTSDPSPPPPIQTPLSPWHFYIYSDTAYFRSTTGPVCVCQCVSLFLAAFSLPYSPNIKRGHKHLLPPSADYRERCYSPSEKLCVV